MTRPLHILHTEASCGWGGQEIRILEESTGMIARGHSITIVCPKESTIFQEATDRGIHCVSLPIAKKTFKGFFSLRRWLSENPVDIINTHSSTDTWLTILATKTIRDAPHIIRTRHISSPIPNNWLSQWSYRNAVSHVVTTGESLRHQVISQTSTSPERVTSIPTGIDTTRFFPGDKRAVRNQLGLDPEKNYIGIIATLRSWKGHEYLLKAFASIHLPDWKLLIVGDGPMREKIKESIVDLNINERVILAGQQKNPELWMRSIDIFCLPSYANEGVPQAILQAMFTALPIISTPIGAILEVIKDKKTGIITQPKNASEITEKLSLLIDNNELRTQLGSNAYAWAKKNASKETMLEKMEKVFLNSAS
jgi:glycosyltransferase involved in cell wall biosynthesis